MTAQEKRPRVLRSFITTEYLPNSKNQLVPGTISKCPLGEVSGSNCHLRSKGWRKRKCGSFERLKKCICLIHRIIFTIYPFGTAPYFRKSFTRSPSLFAALCDANQGIKWPETFKISFAATHKTQKRHISLWTKITGVSSEITDSIRLEIAMLLGVPNISLVEQAKKIRDGPTSYKDRARIVIAILSPVIGALSTKSLLLIGHSLKLWGKPITNLKSTIFPLHFSIDLAPPNLSPP